MHVAQNWPNLEKRPRFLQFLSKLSGGFLVKDLTNLLFTLNVSFWEQTFLAKMQRLKNAWTLSAPPRAYFLNFPKKKLVKADIKQLSPKEKSEKFWWKLKEYKPYPYSMGGLGLCKLRLREHANCVSSTSMNYFN